MAKINLNALAKDVTLAEGGKESLSVAQVKEVIKQTLSALKAEWEAGNEVGVVELVKRS